MALFSKTQHVSWLSSTGDGGTLTEVTDGNQRMNGDTSEQILERHRWVVDNHVALTGCQPTGSFCVIHWCIPQHYIIIIASHQHFVGMIHTKVCAMRIFSFTTVSNFHSFTLNVEYKILSECRFKKANNEFFTSARQHCAPSARLLFLSSV